MGPGAGRARRTGRPCVRAEGCRIRRPDLLADLGDGRTPPAKPAAFSTQRRVRVAHRPGRVPSKPSPSWRARLEIGLIHQLKGVGLDADLAAEGLSMAATRKITTPRNRLMTDVRMTWTWISMSSIQSRTMLRKAPIATTHQRTSGIPVVTSANRERRTSVSLLNWRNASAKMISPRLSVGLNDARSLKHGHALGAAGRRMTRLWTGHSWSMVNLV